MSERPFPERRYQQEALLASAGALVRDGLTRQVIGLPTGTGKTVILANLLSGPHRPWLDLFPASQRRMLVVAHREELLDQAADKIGLANPSLRIEVEQATRRASKHADVVVASVQTLAAAGGRRLASLDPNEFRIVAIDECHHATATTYRRVATHFQFLPPEGFRPVSARTAEDALRCQRARMAAWDKISEADRLLLGITATPQRGDGVGLEGVFQRIVYSRSIQDMMREGFLCRLRGIRVASLTSLDQVRLKAGDLDVADLAEAVNVLSRNQLAVQAYREHAAGRRAVVFCVNVAHAKSLAASFVTAKYRAAAIDGGMPSPERQDILRAFREREMDVLCNCQILTEGWDDPGVDCIIHARPTKSSLLYIQMTGRGTRLHAGKTDCLVIDVVDQTRRHALVSLPSLFGLPIGFNPEGADILEVADEVQSLLETHPSVTSTTIRDLRLQAEEVDLFATVDPVLEEHATQVWGRIDGRYVLGVPISGAGNILLDVGPNMHNGWDVLLHSTYEPYHKWNEYRPTRLLATATSLPAAIKRAERQFAFMCGKPLAQFHSRNRPEPIRMMSSKQAKQFRAFGYPAPNPETMTHWMADVLLALLLKRKRQRMTST